MLSTGVEVIHGALVVAEFVVTLRPELDSLMVAIFAGALQEETVTAVVPIVGVGH